MRFLLVPVIGVEPIRYCYHGILSPARLPIPPHRRVWLNCHYILYDFFSFVKGFKEGFFLFSSIYQQVYVDLVHFGCGRFPFLRDRIRFRFRRHRKPKLEHHRFPVQYHTVYRVRSVDFVMNSCCLRYSGLFFLIYSATSSLTDLNILLKK